MHGIYRSASSSKKCSPLLAQAKVGRGHLSAFIFLLMAVPYTLPYPPLPSPPLQILTLYPPH